MNYSRRNSIHIDKAMTGKTAITKGPHLIVLKMTITVKRERYRYIINIKMRKLISILVVFKNRRRVQTTMKKATCIIKNNQKRSKISTNLHTANRKEHSSKSQRATKLYHSLKQWMNLHNNNKAIYKPVLIAAENSTKMLTVSISKFARKYSNKNGKSLTHLNNDRFKMKRMMVDLLQKWDMEKKQIKNLELKRRINTKINLLNSRIRWVNGKLRVYNLDRQCRHVEDQKVDSLKIIMELIMGQELTKFQMGGLSAHIVTVNLTTKQLKGTFLFASRNINRV